MKKTINISITQTAFTLEEDAFIALDTYLHSIKNHFASNTDKDEIVNDIENRIAEKLSDLNKSIITLPQVEHIIADMGTVHQFDDDTVTTENEQKTPPKKLYRDTDEAVIAGVAAGIAHYIGTDKIIPRVIFAVLAFFGGFGPLLYIILWMVIPEAKSASQKLEMRGNPVNLETLSTMMKEKIDDFANPAKKHAFKSLLMIPIKILRAIASGIQHIIFPAIRIIIGVMLMLGGIAVAIGSSIVFGILLLGIPVGFIPAELTSLFHGALFYFTLILGYLTILAPSILIFFGGLGIIQKKRILSKAVTISLIVITFFSLVIASISGGRFAMVARNTIRSSPLYQEQTMEIVDLDAFTAISSSNTVRVTVVQGDKYQVTLSGRTYDINNSTVSVTDGVLSLGEKDGIHTCLFCSRRSISATITAPNITAITALDASRIEGTLASTSTISLTARDVARIDMQITTATLSANLTGAARIVLSGNTETETIIASDVSRFEGALLEARDATVDASDVARVIVTPTISLSGKTTDGSRILYTKIPHTLSKETKDVSSIQHLEE